MSGRIWLDVEDIFEYAAFNARLTGIQRVEFELCRALAELDGTGGKIGFVRHDPRTQAFRTVSWPDVLAIAERLTDEPAPEARAGLARDAGGGFARRGIKRGAYALPPELRQPLVSFLVEQRQAARSLAGLLLAAGNGLVRRVRARPARSAAAGQPFAASVRAGDTILVLGAIWYHPGYASFIRGVCERHGLRFAMMVHDLIPLRRPEWCKQTHVRLFRDWFTSVVESARPVLAISRSTARDVERYAAECGLSLSGTVRVIPMGAGFSAGRKEGAAATPPRRPLPPPGTYALIVSTLEVRKNHLLLFRVWRRLLDEMPRERVPRLVFAGRIGWMVADLLEQLRNCDYLDGHVVLVENPTDAELRALYGGCLFTLFPSFHEGWGLPVTESLAFGRPCIASDATSLPEAGGTLARYIDPDDATAAVAAIRSVIEDADGLATWRARIEREFRPTSWRESAAALLEAVRAN